MGRRCPRCDRIAGHLRAVPYECYGVVRSDAGDDIVVGDIGAAGCRHGGHDGIDANRCSRNRSRIGECTVALVTDEGASGGAACSSRYCYTSRNRAFVHDLDASRRVVKPSPDRGSSGCSAPAATPRLCADRWRRDSHRGRGSWHRLRHERPSTAPRRPSRIWPGEIHVATVSIAKIR